MRTVGLLVKLLIVALVLHATWRSASAYWLHSKFRNGLRDIAQFSARQSEHAVRDRGLQLAATLNLRVRPDDLIVTRRGEHTRIDASYVTRIELLPRHSYPWKFHVEVEAGSVDFYKEGISP